MIYKVFSTLTGQEHSLGDKLFLAHFDDSATTSENEIPKLNSGSSYETGQIASGIHINDSDKLVYNTTDNIDLSAGSIEFWLKPTWARNDNNKYSFFCSKSSSNDGQISFGKFYGNASTPDFHDYLFFSFTGTDGTSWCEANTWHIENETGLVENWTANSWHHIVGTWNETNESIKLYLDGEYIIEWNTSLQPECNWSNYPTNLGENLSIGYLCTAGDKQADSGKQ